MDLENKQLLEQYKENVKDAILEHEDQMENDGIGYGDWQLNERWTGLNNILYKIENILARDEKGEKQENLKEELAEIEESMIENDIFERKEHKVENPKKEQPREEGPKVEKPKKEQPREEEPKVEKPKKEQPREEGPKVEKPKKEQPREEGPKAGNPKKEQPREEGPKAENPKKEQPREEGPKAEKPKKEQPREKEHKAEEPIELKFDDIVTPTEEQKVEGPKKKEPPIKEPEVIEASKNNPKEDGLVDEIKNNIILSSFESELNDVVNNVPKTTQYYVDAQKITYNGEEFSHEQLDEMIERERDNITDSLKRIMSKEEMEKLQMLCNRYRLDNAIVLINDEKEGTFFKLMQKANKLKKEHPEYEKEINKLSKEAMKKVLKEIFIPKIKSFSNLLLEGKEPKEEYKIDMHYNLKHMSELGRVRHKCDLMPEEIKKFKAAAFHFRNRATVEMGLFTKIKFSLKNRLSSMKRKRLMAGKETGERAKKKALKSQGKTLEKGKGYKGKGLFRAIKRKITTVFSKEASSKRLQKDFAKRMRVNDSQMARDNSNVPNVQSPDVSIQR